jgi:hypothetical protein
MVAAVYHVATGTAVHGVGVGDVAGEIEGVAAGKQVERAGAHRVAAHVGVAGVGQRDCARLDVLEVGELGRLEGDRAERLEHLDVGIDRERGNVDCGAGFEVQDVEAGSAVVGLRRNDFSLQEDPHPVVAETAVHRVLAVTTDQQVVADAAVQRVVAA